MTSKERIVAALEGLPTDRTPWSPFLAYVWESFPADVQALGQPEFLRRVGADPLWRGAVCPVQGSGPDNIEYHSFEENGVNVCVTETPVGSIRSGSRPSPQGNTSLLVEHPLKTEEAFKVWLWIEERQTYTYHDEYVKDHLAGAGAEGLTAGMLIPRGKSAYQDMVEHLVGTEPTMFLNLTLEQLDPYVRGVIADAQGGPFVLANSDSCPPGVTIEKFKLVGDIVRNP